MKASIIFIIALLFFSSFSFSQALLERGTFSINGNISFTSYYEETSDFNSTIFIFNPRFDYFLIDNFSLGLMLNFQNTSFYGRDNSTWGIGPSIRYYFDVQNIKPFAGIGYSFASENSSISDGDLKHNNIILNIGADYFITNNVALETILSYTFMNTKFPKEYNTFYSDLEASRKSLSIGLGVNVFLR